MTNEMLLAVLPDTPIAAENKAKPIIPVTNTFLCPKRSPTLPIVIKVTANASRYPLVTHWMLASERVQVSLDLRVGHRDDRAVQRHHHHAQGDRYQCQARVAVWRARARAPATPHRLVTGVVSSRHQHFLSRGPRLDMRPSPAR